MAHILKRTIPTAIQGWECKHPECDNTNLHTSKKGNVMVVCRNHLNWLFNESDLIKEELISEHYLEYA